MSLRLTPVVTQAANKEKWRQSFRLSPCLMKTAELFMSRKDKDIKTEYYQKSIIFHHISSVLKRKYLSDILSRCFCIYASNAKKTNQISFLYFYVELFLRLSLAWHKATVNVPLSNYPSHYTATLALPNFALGQTPFTYESKRQTEKKMDETIRIITSFYISGFLAKISHCAFNISLNPRYHFFPTTRWVVSFNFLRRR